MNNKILSTKNKPHAILITQSKFSDFNAFLKSYLKSIICSDGGCNKCEWCKKVDNNQYFDLVVLDAAEGIKKNDVMELMKRFNISGLEEKNKKFYVIKNIELLSKTIINSLLKFVEEPPLDTYAIFTTKNYNAVLSTIRSRCMNVILSGQENSVDAYLSSSNVSEKMKKIIKQIFNDLDEIKQNINNFDQLYNFAEEVLSEHLLNKIGPLAAKFKKMEYSEINVIIQIIKNLIPKNALELTSIQSILYLNPNKTSIFNQLIDLIK